MGDEVDEIIVNCCVRSWTLYFYNTSLDGSMFYTYVALHDASTVPGGTALKRQSMYRSFSASSARRIWVVAMSCL
jgi:hypothetical protein